MVITARSPINTKPNILLPTYRVAFKDLAGDADLAVSLRGSATKVIRVTHVDFSKPSAAQAPMQLVKTLSAAHGGTFTTPTPIPLDSLDPVALSVVRFYTTEPVNGDEAIGQVWQVDTTPTDVFVDETTDANDAGSGDWVIFTASEAIGDYMAIGFVEKFGGFIFDNAGGTAGVAGVVIWEYWNGTAWAALAGVVDGTTGFTIAVTDGQVLSFDVPTDWEKSIINGSADLYYIRARITTVFSTNPVYDQGFIDPAGSEVGGGSVFEADVLATDILSVPFGVEVNTKPVILRGIEESLELNLSADAILNGYIEWTEN